MRDLDDDKKYSIRYQAVAVARDVMTISAVITLLSAIFWFVARPYLTPFLELPEKVAEINARIAPFTSPHLVEFKGPAYVIGEKSIARGGNIRLMYNLRRNADCDTEILFSFVNVDTGTTITTGTGRSVQAPVTEDFSTFFLMLHIPENLPTGNYSYYPRLTPINCGVYRAYNGALSEPFEVF